METGQQKWTDSPRSFPRSVCRSQRRPSLRPNPSIQSRRRFFLPWLAWLLPPTTGPSSTFDDAASCLRPCRAVRFPCNFGRSTGLDKAAARHGQWRGPRTRRGAAGGNSSWHDGTMTGAVLGLHQQGRLASSKGVKDSKQVLAEGGRAVKASCQVSKVSKNRTRNKIWSFPCQDPRTLLFTGPC